MRRAAARLSALWLAVAFAAAPAQAEIAIVPVTSPGGIAAWLHEDHSIPMLSIQAAFPGGPAFDAEDKLGATALMANLLDEGAGDLDSIAFGTALEELASYVDFWTSDDVVGLSATMLAENRDATVELVRLALTEPRFDAEPVERVRAGTLANIRSVATDPGSLASLAFFDEAFPNHPYGRPIQGVLETVTVLDVNDLRAAHGRALTRDGVLVAVVGDIGPEEAGAMLDRLFGALPAEGPALPEPPETGLAGQTLVIDLGIPQTLAVFGTDGLAVSDPDILPAMVMDYVLGGENFGSRLNRELRGERGLTYGIQTGLQTLRLGGVYYGSFSSSNARAGEALEVVRDEWERLGREGAVTEAELSEAKQYLTGEYALRFDGIGPIAGALLGTQMAGHGPDYVNLRNGLVEAVTAEDVARVARRLLKPETLTTVAVGRPEGIDAE